MKKSWLAVPAIAVAGLLVTDAKEAKAGEGWYAYPFHSYSGSTCQQQYESQQTWLRAGWGYNMTTSATTVWCPITRRNPNSSLGISFAVVYINNPYGTFSCTLYHHGINGNVVKSSTKSTTATGQRALYFDAISGVESWGNYSMYCSVPSHGFINNYYLNESY